MSAVYRAAIAAAEDVACGGFTFSCQALKESLLQEGVDEYDTLQIVLRYNDTFGECPAAPDEGGSWCISAKQQRMACEQRYRYGTPAYYQARIDLRVMMLLFFAEMNRSDPC